MTRARERERKTKTRWRLSFSPFLVSVSLIVQIYLLIQQWETNELILLVIIISFDACIVFCRKRAGLFTDK